MTKYRIVMIKKRYGFQRKFLCFWLWVRTIGDSCFTVGTESAARNKIKEWQEEDLLDGKVIE